MSLIDVSSVPIRPLRMSRPTPSPSPTASVYSESTSPAPTPHSHELHTMHSCKVKRTLMRKVFDMVGSCCFNIESDSLPAFSCTHDTPAPGVDGSECGMVVLSATCPSAVVDDGTSQHMNVRSPHATSSSSALTQDNGCSQAIPPPCVASSPLPIPVIGRRPDWHEYA